MSRIDQNSVLNDGINTAVYFLEKSGEFYPFGVVKTAEGEIRHLQAQHELARPLSSDIKRLLEDALAKQGSSGGHQIVAIVSNVQLTDRESNSNLDAICVEIDDAEAEPILCYVPFSLESGVVSLGEIRAGKGRRIAFQ